MAQLAAFKYELTVEGPTGVEHHLKDEKFFVPVTTAGAGHQRVSCTASTFTPITIPTGAQFIAIAPGTATGLTLKGITGDTGFPLVPTSNPSGICCFFTLGATPSVGIANSVAAAQVVDVWIF